MARIEGALDLDEIRSLLGKERDFYHRNERFWAEEPIEKSEIRRYALSNGDCNPLWIDEEYARKTRWGGIMAPPTFLSVNSLFEYAAIPMRPEPIMVPVHIKGFDDDWAVLFLGCEFELFHPVRVGDRLRPKQKLIDIQERSSRFAERMVIFTGESTSTNQNGQVVATLRTKMARYSIDAAQQKSFYEGPKAPEDEDELTPVPEYRIPKSTARGATPLYYEDVNVGDKITPLVKKLTIPGIVAQASCWRVGLSLPETAPGIACTWHYVTRVAWQHRGLKAPFDFGPIRSSWMSQVVTDWMGDDAWLRRLNTRMLLPVYAGDTTTITGEITSKSVKDGEHCVEFDIVAENQRGEISTRAQATVILPSRS